MVRQGLGENSLTAEKKYSINFTVTKKKFCLGLHYNGANSYLFVNATEIYKFKANDSEIVLSPSCLGNISKDWSVDNMKKLDLLIMFMILVQVIVLLQLIILKIFIIIWWKKIIWYDKHVHIPKKQWLEKALYKMKITKQINIKNWTYYFYNDIINLENIDAKLLKIDKKSYEDIGIYNIGYVTKKKVGDCININSVNPLYLGITHVSGYIEEKDMDKYLVFDSTEENKELLKKYNDVFNAIRDKIKEINSNECDYE